MQQKRHEILALAAFSVSVLVLSSLLSYHGKDPIWFSSGAAAAAPQNWVGVLGANLAWSLFFLFGIGAYGFPLLGFWLSLQALRRLEAKPLGWGQALALSVALLSFTALITLAYPRMTHFGQKLLSGGQIGLLLSEFLAHRINRFGSWLLLLSTLVTALLLGTPLTLKGCCRTIMGLLVLVGRAALYPARLALQRRAERTRPKDTGAAPAERRATAQPKAPRVNPSAPSEAPSPPEPVAAPVAMPRPVAVSSRGAPVPRVPSITGGQEYALPQLELLDLYDVQQSAPDPKELNQNARILEQKLADFGVSGEVVDIQPGPVITMYEYAPAPGIKISRIVSLADDLSMALKAVSIRVVAPIPGKAAIGIELPNRHRELVTARSVFESDAFTASSAPLTMALGKTITGRPAVANLAKMPHLLIAGATGTGKSVCINTVLCSLLFRNTPEHLRLLLVDPKRIELSSYEGIPHLLHPVVTDAKMATRALRWAVQEMELRYKLIADKNVRNIESYNKLMVQEAARQAEPPPGEGAAGLPHHFLPLIVIVIDELADLMMVASRDVEECIIRLAQMARAAGIHLILATQRPSVDVLTGIIKANIPTRISFQVSSRVDSRTILDTGGAETLLGAGDMLFLPPGTAKLQRIHGAFISEQEVQRVTGHWQAQELTADPLTRRVDFEDTQAGDAVNEEDLDEKYDEAVELVVKTRQASISMLQRRLRVGYNRAARMIEIMEQQGIVGPSEGGKPREILLPQRS